MENRTMGTRQVRARETEFSVRSDEDGKQYIEGYFAVFNSVYEIAPGMSESVAPEAFNNTISDDIRCLTDHDTRLVLGRTSAHTFEVRVDAHGLWGRALINPNDLDAVNTKARVDRGDINQASFGFDIVKEDTDIREDGSVHFTIREVKLYECSVVAFPAYAETNISSRARDAELAKERAKKAEEQRHEAWKAEMKKRIKGGAPNGTEKPDEG
jgi:HK97 family phage prohead protease